MDDLPDGFAIFAAPVALAMLTLVSSLAHRQSRKRRNPDKVGIVPWEAVSVVSFMGTLLSLAWVLGLFFKGKL